MAMNGGMARRRHERRFGTWTLMLLLMMVTACGDDGGPAGPGGDDDPPPPPASFDVVVPADVVEGRDFQLGVTALAQDGTTAAHFSGTVGLSVSAGSITPTTLTLAAGTATTTARITGTRGDLTISASDADADGSAAITVLRAADQLTGDPASPVAEAIPDSTYRPRPEDFSTDHPELEGFPLSFNTLILALERDVTVGQANLLLDDLLAEIVGGIPGVTGQTSGLLVLRVPTEGHAEMDALLADLGSEPSIRVVARDALMTPDVISHSNGTGPSDPAGWVWDILPAGGNWGLELIRVPALWNLNNALHKRLAGSTPSVLTGILDTGFAPDESHPDLRYDENQTEGEEGDHGTHVAGIVGATFDNRVGIDGLNPYARLVVRARTASLEATFDGHESWAGALLFELLDLIRSRQPDIRVVNVSLGFDWPSVNVDANTNPEAQDVANDAGKAMLEALETVQSEGVPLPVIVSSAGNESSAGFGVQVALYHSPLNNAAIEQGARNIIVVEALNQDSSQPGGATRRASSNVGGHLSAPGGDILSTVGAPALYGTMSGTSMAAPHVAGLVGYLYVLAPALPPPTLSSNPVLDLLTASAVDVGGGARDRIDAFAAALEIDRSTADDRILKMLVDFDDGTPDGNRRTDPQDLSPFEEMDADGDGGPGDGRIDMADFRRWRDGFLYLDAPPGLALDGGELHSKKNLNGNGIVHREDEFLHPFIDLNGDGLVALPAKAFVGGSIQNQVTDIQVLQHLFEDPHYDAADLPGLVHSADIAVHPEFVLEQDAHSVRSYVYRTSDDVLVDQRVHTANPADGDGPHQIYTVPATAPDNSYRMRLVAVDAAADTLFDDEKTVALAPGEDVYWDPKCPFDPQPSAASLTATSSAAEPICQLDAMLLFVNPDPADLRVLTTDRTIVTIYSGPGNDFPRWPQYSPDGSRIAFHAFHSGSSSSDIWVIDADGSGETRLTSSPHTDAAAEWSPDGSKIAFVRLPEIAVVDASGGPVTMLTDFAQDSEMGATGGPSWSPDGSTLVFAGAWKREGLTEYDIFLLPASGGSPTRVTDLEGPETYHPAWSPDGEWIAFGVRAWPGVKLAITRPDGSELRVLAESTHTHQRIWRIGWTSDGSRIIFGGRDDFVEGATSGTFTIWSIKPDGSGLRRELQDALYPDWNPTVPGFPPAGVSPPRRRP